MEKINLIDFVNGNTKVLEERRKKKKKKKTSKKKRGGIADSWYTSGGGINISGGDAGLGESLICEILAGITPASFSANVNSATAYSKNEFEDDENDEYYDREYYSKDDYEEEVEVRANKVDQARQIFQTMINRPDANRASILNAFIKDVGVTKSTAISYYTRFLEEFGLNKEEREALNKGKPLPRRLGAGTGEREEIQKPQQKYGEPEPELLDKEPPREDEDPDRAGIIRTVKNAHLVYKRQSENGTYEELWIYNIHNDTNDEIDIKRDILAGTDIPPNKTRSEDGVQSYTIKTLGNAQMIHIKGLPN